MTSWGWAVVAFGEINVRTVSLTRRAAIVNWLILNGTLVLSAHNDTDVEELWLKKKLEGMDCLKVRIEVSQ